MAVSRDPANKQGKKVFRSRLLDALYKSSVPSVFITYTPLIIALYWYGFSQGYIHSATQVIGWFVASLFVWSFVEYMMHRFAFHVLEENPKYERAYYLIHGRHHEFPKDQDRLFMPPLAGIALAAIFFGLFYIIIGTNVYAFMPGFIFGYVAYALVHYAMHRYKAPKFLEALWRNHHLHHFRHPQKGFGVSTTLWDYILGTVPPKPKKKKAA